MESLTMSETQNIIKDAVAFLIDKYGADQMLDVHLELDNTPDDLFFDCLTDELAKIFPHEFNSGI
jgi:hypothetical protein